MGEKRVYRMTVGVLVLFALVLPLVAWGCGSGSGASTPQAAVNNFLNAIQKADWNTYLNSINPSNVKSMTSADTKTNKDQLNSIKETYSGMKLKVNNDPNDQNKATVSITAGTVTSTDKKTGQKQSVNVADYKKQTGQYPSIPVVKVKGSWYVDVPLASSQQKQQQQQQQQQAPQSVPETVPQSAPQTVPQSTP